MLRKWKTAVLLHGCHLQADLNRKAWEDIVWAFKNGLPTLEGRATMGLKVAFETDAEFIIFSTGASERDGVKEGEFTKSFAMMHSGMLAATLEADEETLLDLLRNRSKLDLESQNTRDECERNFRLCISKGIERVILVSSPWHIERCHAEALRVAHDMRTAGEAVPEIVAIASHGSTEGVVVFEPPHRGDQPKHGFLPLVGRLFKVPVDQRPHFEVELGELLTKYGG